ncbi:12136_t:CDS:2, partial [Dentiscutata erythropus]
QIYEKFEDAIHALGLLDEENNEFDKRLTQDLFDNNYQSLIEDYCRAIKKDLTDLTSEQVKLFKTKALIDIEKYLIHFRKNLVDFNFDKLDYTLADLTPEEINIQYQLLMTKII